MRIGRGPFYCIISLWMALGPALHADVAPDAQPKQAQPGWDLVITAADAYAADKGPKGSPDAGGDFLVPADDLARQRATIARNAEALKMIRAALAAGIVRPPGLDFQTEDLNKMRALGRLLAQESRVRAADKDWAGAAQSALDSINLFIQLPRGGLQIHALVGVAGESMGLRELRALRPSLPPAVARDTAAKLLRLDAVRVTGADTVRAERDYSWKAITAQFAEPNWKNRGHLPKWEDLPADQREDGDKAAYETWRTITETEVEKEFKDHTGIILAWAQLSPRHDWKTGPALPPARFALTRTINDLWTPGALFGTARSPANARLLAARLAAGAFHAESNRWPTTLDELVPAYLPAVPLDPFSGHPLRYKIKDGAPLLYSIGPDGADDGGRAIRTTARDLDFANPAGLPPRAQRAADNTGRLTADSRGDLVEGLTF